jgi:hypothetical protein
MRRFLLRRENAAIRNPCWRSRTLNIMSCGRFPWGTVRLPTAGGHRRLKSANRHEPFFNLRQHRRQCLPGSLRFRLTCRDRVSIISSASGLRMPLILLIPQLRRGWGAAGQAALAASTQPLDHCPFQLKLSRTVTSSHPCRCLMSEFRVNHRQTGSNTGNGVLSERATNRPEPVEIRNQRVSGDSSFQSRLLSDSGCSFLYSKARGLRSWRELQGIRPVRQLVLMLRAALNCSAVAAGVMDWSVELPGVFSSSQPSSALYVFCGRLGGNILPKRCQEWPSQSVLPSTHSPLLTPSTRLPRMLRYAKALQSRRERRFRGKMGVRNIKYASARWTPVGR